MQIKMLWNTQINVLITTTKYALVMQFFVSFHVDLYNISFMRISSIFVLLKRYNFASHKDEQYKLYLNSPFNTKEKIIILHGFNKIK